MKKNKLRILYVSYPLLPVSEESAGGAEQMLWVLESEMRARGHSTTVAASDGSRVAGELVSTGAPPSEPDRFEQRSAEHSSHVLELVSRRQQGREPFDLVHDESGHFWRNASMLQVPVLATVHLPRHMYHSDMFASFSSNLFFNCVSESQLRSFRDLPRMLGVVENGVETARFPFSERKRDYLLWMGRICEEKGTHIAVDVAEDSGIPLIIAGQVYPFSYHQEYFTRQVVPRLERASVRVQFVQKPSFTEKVNLLQNARAVLIPALVDETSSLVAMEAMACGTPVIAFRRGALSEIIVEGDTGILVNSPDEMVEATRRINEINPQSCRNRVEALYDSRRMARGYETLYDRVLNIVASSDSELKTA